jgi:outer membrane protein assembly factor BamA
LDAKTSSSAVGVAFAHDASDNRFSLDNSVSGGPLGGTENVLRSNDQYARIFPDPIIDRQNAWAFRVSFSGAGSYEGEMPFYARLLSGDSQVRGFSPGQLGPYAVIPTTSANGPPGYTAVPSGANIISAANAEYRVPLGGGVQAVSFFDLGSGWLMPNWLGQTRPVLLDSTNGVLHGSFGLQLQWTVPEIQVPVRAYVSVNLLRLNKFLTLPDGSLFHAHNKLFSLGWALGNLF